MKHVIEGLVTAMILGMISGFIGLFLHVQELDAKSQVNEERFQFISKDLKYLKGRIDFIYEKHK